VAVALHHAGGEAEIPAVLHLAPGDNGALIQGFGFVRDDQIGLDLHLGAKTAAGRAGAVRGVEGEHARGQLLVGDAAFDAGIVLAEEQLVAADDVDEDDARGEAERGFDRISETGDYARADDETVDDHLDIMLFILVEPNLLIKLEDLAVDTNADIAIPARLFKDLTVLPLAAAHHRREDLDPGLGRQGHDLVDDLLDGLAFDLFAAVVAVRDPDAGEEQAQVVIDLGHGPHC